MKKIALFLLGLLILLPSCVDLLVEEPKSFLQVDDFYQDEKEAYIGVIGLYSDIANSKLYGQTLSRFVSVGTDLAYYRNNSGSVHYIGNYLMTPSNGGGLDGTWIQAYHAINDCNLFLEKTSKMEDADLDVITRLQAEAHFIRGLVYFEMARLYGGVPLLLDVIKDVNVDADKMQVSRASLEEIYGQVIKDLDFASEHLPSFAEMSSAEYPRVTRDAALGILARVYLTMAGEPLNDATKYELAAAAAKEVIDMGNHSLIGDFRQVWWNIYEDKFDPRECLFEIGYTAGGALGNNIGTWGGISSMRGPAGEDGKNVGGGYSYMKCTVHYRELFGAGKNYDPANADVRYHHTCIPYKLDGRGEPFLKDGAIAEQKEWALSKYRKKPSNGAYHYNKNGNNWVALRYSDVLLMYAEAENEVHGASRNALANECVKQVRFRAFRSYDRIGNMTQNEDGAIEGVAYNYDYSGMDQSQFRQLVRDERARELGGEATRRYDLVRWGDLYAAVKSLDGVEPKGYCWANVQPYHTLFPIPQRERDLNDKLDQNPGY